MGCVCANDMLDGLCLCLVLGARCVHHDSSVLVQAALWNSLFDSKLEKNVWLAQELAVTKQAKETATDSTASRSEKNASPSRNRS